MRKTRKFSALLVLVILVMCVVVIRGFVAGGKQEESEVSTLAKASIPTITMNYQEEKVNCIQGYAREMSSVNQVLTPLGEEKKLIIDIGKTPYDIVAVEYAISHDGALIEQRCTEKIKKQKEGTTATLDLSNSVTSNTEFNLKIVLETKEESKFYYYTRVIHTTEFEAAEAIAFAEEFCENTFNKRSSDKIVAYIEPDETRDNTTYEHVNIHSSYEQITWGKMDAKKCSEPVPTILELNDTEAIVSLDYQASVKEDEETNSYYLVHEYYRMRRSSYRMHLLEYERNLTQTFVGTKLSITGDAITLGIVPKDVEYACSKDGTLVCFEQAGELWLYQVDGNKLFRIFSLQDTDRQDKRSYMQDYDIRILNLDNKGAVDFVVYGYCNRGSYEGKVCMQLCKYTKKSNTYEVRYVIEDTCGADLFCEDVGTYTYLAENKFYYYHYNNVYCVNLETGEESILIEGVTRDALVVSDSCDKIAWVEDLYTASTIFQIDLKKNERREITSEEEEYLRPIGYVKNDFAYGIAKKSQVTPGLSGKRWFPMYSVVICDEDGKVIKDYTDETLLVVNGYTTSDMIHLERVQPSASGMGYVAAQDHQIVSSKEADQQPVMVETTTDSKKKKLVQLVFAVGHGANAIHRYTADELVRGTVAQKNAEKHGANEEFYVYNDGKLDRIFARSKDAFVYAQENNGVLKNSNFKTIYYKRNYSNKYLRQAPPLFDASVLTQGVLESNLVAVWQSKTTEGTVYDATGFPLEGTKQLIEDGWSVLIQTGAQELYMLVGYTEETMFVYQPMNGQTTELATQQLESLYEQFGRVCAVCK